MKRILIVDDEQPARARLRHLLAQCAGGPWQIDEAADAVEALARFEAQRPDLMFLDIALPETSGLALAASLPAPAPPLVFVTAWDQYALAAFDANAIDYLLKPYDLARLQRALERALARLPVVQASAPPGLPVRQLLVAERGVTRVVPVAQIGWIETADNYVVLHCDGARPLLRQSLAALVDSLGPGFVRCHRRAAVQLAWVERFVSLDKGDGVLLLRGGAQVPCSRQYRADVLARLARQATS